MDTEDSDCSFALTERVKNYAKAVLTKERYEHSLRVAETASRLCKKYGLDTSRGYLAGIAHDMCKDMSDEKIAALAREDGKAITELEAQKPSLLHGRAAALMLRRDFGVTIKTYCRRSPCIRSEKKACVLFRKSFMPRIKSNPAVRRRQKRIRIFSSIFRLTSS
ncbi:HD domain-containing protein [Treponema socranskii]|uniref:HD domain-containing protein n=1 Tax=Treponema socranskii TaxID=53419 RepID=UPI003D92CA08